MDKGLLVVSFGTSHKDTREKTIDAIEKQLAFACPERQFKKAYTSSIIRKLIKKNENITIRDVKGAFEDFVAEGITDILVQPTHVIHGAEYDKIMKAALETGLGMADIKLGNALLDSSRDYEEVCKGVVKAVQAEGYDVTNSEIALVLMGHGTEHHSDSAYAALDYRFKALGYPHVYVATVEGYPDLETVKEAVARQGAREVVLMPFMMVAGDHAKNDMAGEEEDSWKSQFEKEGYEVNCILKGLGEFDFVRRMFIRHLQMADSGK